MKSFCTEFSGAIGRAAAVFGNTLGVLSLVCGSVVIGTQVSASEGAFITTVAVIAPTVRCTAIVPPVFVGLCKKGIDVIVQQSGNEACPTD